MGGFIVNSAVIEFSENTAFNAQPIVPDLSFFTFFTQCFKTDNYIH